MPSDEQPDEPSSSFNRESDLGDAPSTTSILRRKTEQEQPTVADKHVSWDENNLPTKKQLVEAAGTSKKKKKKSKKKSKSRKQQQKSDDDGVDDAPDAVMEDDDEAAPLAIADDEEGDPVIDDDNEAVEAPKKKKKKKKKAGKKKPKGRKQQQKVDDDDDEQVDDAAVVAVEDDDVADLAPLAIADDEDEEEGGLVIDEGNEEDDDEDYEAVEAPKKKTKKSKKKQSEEALRAKEEAIAVRHAWIYKQLAERTFVTMEECEERMALYAELAYWGSKKRPKKYKLKSKAQKARELQKEFERTPAQWRECIERREEETMKKWRAKWAAALPSNDEDVDVDSEECGNFGEEGDEDEDDGYELEWGDDEGENGQNAGEEEEEADPFEGMEDEYAPDVDWMLADPVVDGAKRRRREASWSEGEEKRSKKGGKKNKKKAIEDVEMDAIMDTSLGGLFDDVDNLMAEWNAQADEDRRGVEESEAEEEGYGDSQRKGKKAGKKRGGVAAAGAARKKKEEARPQTDAEVMADIGRKKADALEKATRMKALKKQEMERRREERERKRADEEREREEKRTRRLQEAEEARQKKKRASAKSPAVRKPKSRAEAARRTKQLIATPKREAEDVNDEEAEEGPKRKRRKYTRRAATLHPPGYYRPPTHGSDDEEGVVKKEEDDDYCGRYTYNPCEMVAKKLCMDDPLTDFSSCDEDDVLSVPLWTSDQDRLPVGAPGPRNFDPDEAAKRHLNDVETTFTTGLSKEYHEATRRLDAMKMNLFGESMFRRFNPAVVHDMDNKQNVGSWPVDRQPTAGRSVHKYKSAVWQIDAATPFRGLVRIRPLHKERDVRSSHDIDVISGCAGVVATVTRKDIMKNVDELILSKLRGTKYTPLPSNANPWDVPEVTTRKAAVVVAQMRGVLHPKQEQRSHLRPAGGYIDRVAVVALPGEAASSKKRKITRKELLREDHEQKKARREQVKQEEQGMYMDDAFKQEEVDDEDYKYEWDEMAEMVINPMHNGHMMGGGAEDPFAVMDYERMEYNGEEGGGEGGEPMSGGDGDVHDRDVDYGGGGQEMDDDEAGLGEAFNFMANHMDA